MTQSKGAENSFFSVTLYNFQKGGGVGGGGRRGRGLKPSPSAGLVLPFADVHVFCNSFMLRRIII